MINALIALIIVALVVGIVTWIVLQLVAMLPMEANFQNIVRGLVILVAVLIVLYKALPIIGIAVP